MVIDYAIDELKVMQKRLSLKKIAGIIGAHPVAGTAPGNIELINSALLESFPEISLIDSKGGSFQTIRREIDAKRPLIAWIVIAADEQDILYHAVVVNGYEEDLTTLYYVDPEMDKENYQLSAPVGRFIDDKLTVDGHLIKMAITIKGQQDLYQRLHPLKGKRKEKKE